MDNRTQNEQQNPDNNNSRAVPFGATLTNLPAGLTQSNQQPQQNQSPEQQQVQLQQQTYPHQQQQQQYQQQVHDFQQQQRVEQQQTGQTQPQNVPQLPPVTDMVSQVHLQYHPLGKESDQMQPHTPSPHDKGGDDECHQAVKRLKGDEIGMVVDEQTQKIFDHCKEKGLDHCKKKEYADALHYFSKCITVFPSNTIGYTNRAHCFVLQKDYLKAEEDCNQALCLDNTNLKALFNRAMARKGLEKYSAALSDVEIILKHEQGSEKVLELHSELMCLMYKKRCKKHPQHITRKSETNGGDDIIVTFHVILPVAEWEWDENSCIHIELDDNTLAQKTQSLGDFDIVYLLDGYYGVKFNLHLDLGGYSLRTKKELLYKYVVYSKKKLLCESLQWTSIKDATMRCLCIHTATKEYVKYDSLVLPPSEVLTTKSITPESVNTSCLEMYLKRLKKTLCCGSLPQDHSIDVFCMEFGCIYESLESIRVADVKKTVRVKGVDISQGIASWLKSVVSTLETCPFEVKFIAAITIMYCIFCTSVLNSQISQIFEPFLKMCQQGKLNSAVLDLLFKMTSKESRSKIHDGLYNLIRLRVKTNDCLELIRVFPVVHFLHPTRIPYQWNDDDPVLNSIRKKCEQRCDFITQYFAPLKELFELDPLLPQVVLYICPKECLAELVYQMDLNLSVAWLLHVAKRSNHDKHKYEDIILVLESVIRKMSMLFTAMMEYKELHKLLESSLSVLKNVLPKISEVQYLKIFINFTLSAISKIDYMPLSGTKASDALEELENDIKLWFKQPSVIGGSSFGGPDSVWNGKKELELWCEILQTNITVSPSIDGQWQRLLACCIQQRVIETEYLRQIVILHLLEESSCEAIVSAELTALSVIINKAVYQSLDKAFDKQNDKSLEGLRILNKLLEVQVFHSTPHHSCVGKMVDYIFFYTGPVDRSQIATGCCNVSLEQLLSSDLWQPLLKFYNSNSKAKIGLSPECMEMCVCAQKIFQQMGHQVKTGEITRSNFNVITKYLGQVAKLMKLLGGNVDEFMGVKQQREIEFQRFQYFSERFQVFKDNLPNIEALLKLEQALNVDPAKENNQYQEYVYTMAGSMEHVVEMYYLMITTAKNTFFFNGWKTYCSNAISAFNPIKCSDIEVIIWKPTMKRCQEQLEKYKKCLITFNELKKEFAQPINHSYVMEQLQNLAKGMQLFETNSSQRSNDTKWIEDIGKCIQVYQKLVEEYGRNAESILQDKPLQVMQGQYEELEKMVKERKRRCCTSTEHDSRREGPGSGKLTFHVIIPMEAWGWDEYSCVHIRFGEPLGNWKHDLGSFLPSYWNNEVCEMVCTLPINVESITNREQKIEYKYVVYSSKVSHMDDEYEYVYRGEKNGDPYNNRCLVIDQNRIKRGYEQYDALAWPSPDVVKSELIPVSGLVKFWNWITSNPSSPSCGTFGKPFAHSEETKICLKIYLGNFKRALTDCSFDDSFCIESFSDHINHIFTSLQHQSITNKSSMQWKECSSLLQETSRWFGLIIKELDGSTHISRYISAITIICCLYKLYRHKCCTDLNMVRSLLYMIEMKKEYDLKPLLKVCMGGINIYESVSSFFSSYVASQVNFDPQLLKTLPIIHFIKVKSTVIPAIRPKDVKWDDDTLSLHIIKNKFPPQIDVAVQFEELHSLFQLDPLLLYAFIYISPKNALPRFIKRIPIYLSISWLLYYIEHNTVQISGDTSITDLVKDVIEALCDEARLLSSQDYAYVIESLELLLSQTIPHISSTAASFVHLCVSLTLLVVSKRDKINDPDTNPMSSDLLTMLQRFVCNWITCPTLIGSSYFGGPTSSTWRGKKEFEIWLTILQIQHSKCSAIVSANWQQLVFYSVNERIIKIPKEIPFIIQTLHLLEDYDSQMCQSTEYKSLKQVILNGSFSVFNEICGKKMITATLEGLQKVKRQCKCIGLLLDHLFTKNCPFPAPITVPLSLEQLLEWDLWPHFIKQICINSEALEGSSPQCKDICEHAKNRCVEICKQISAGDCTKLHLDKIQAKYGQFAQLTIAIGIALPNGSAENVEKQVTSKLKDYEAFTTLCNKLLHLCTLLPENIAGLSGLKQHCSSFEQFQSLPINKLCLIKNKQYEFVFFQYAGDLIDIVEPFWQVTKTFSSSIFILIWKKTIASSPHAIAITQVKSHIWDPTYDACKVLLQKLSTLSITFSEFNDYFGLNGEPNDIAKELKSYSKGLSSSILDNVCIKQICACVETYRKLQQNYQAADLILTIRNLLSLKGSFDDLEYIAEQASHLQTWTLEFVFKEMASAATLLEEIQCDRDIQHCMKCLRDSGDIIQWLKQETKDVGDLSNFVTVALATAAGGEDALTQDKLSHLRTVGTGFESLIYALPSTASYKDLLTSCQSLLKAIKKNQKLPTLLIACNDDLDWYKLVKETQGSVEVTSIGQLNNIQKYGCYTISSGDKSFQTIYDIVEMKLEEQDKRLPKHKYTLDELRDLESKLVLITGSNAENRKEVDLFLNTFHSICSIAEALLALQKAGHVEYIGWTMQCPCTQDHVSKLQDQAKLMEQKINEWEQYVNGAREQFYAMNYYTTAQLLCLQKELGTMKCSNFTNTLSHHAFLLLQSTSSTMTASEANQVIQDCLKGQLQTSALRPDDIPSTLTDLTTDSTFQPETQSLVSDSFCAKAIDRSSRITALTTAQKELFYNLSEGNGYHPDLVLKGLEECKDPDIYELSNWCNEHADDLEPVLHNVSDSKHTANFDAATDVKCHTVDKKPSNQYLPTIHVEAQQFYNESHPLVEKFVEAGFSLEDSIDAVAHCNANEEAALTYLFSSDTAGSLFSDTQPSPNMAGLISSNTPAHERSKNIAISPNTHIKSSYLDIEEIGSVLKTITEHFAHHVCKKRPFPAKFLKTGSPNLVVTEPSDVLGTVLSLYMQDSALPLPTMEEVLICSKYTTDEDVILLWRRAVADPDFTRIFCLVHAERLTYQVSDKVLQSLKRITQGKSEYRLVIICSSEGEQQSHILSKLHVFKRQFTMQPVSKCAEYLSHHFKIDTDGESYGKHISASTVDIEKSNVRVVTSQRSGMGKSLYIKRMAQTLMCRQNNPTDYHTLLVTIPVHGPLVTANTVMEYLKDHLCIESTIFHFDVASDVVWQVDTILFSLLVLKGITDSHGRLWRCHNTNLSAVEVTVPGCKDDYKQGISIRCTLQLLDLLPSVKCVSPQESVSLASIPIRDTTKVSIDEKKFSGKTYKLVYQYLSHKSSGQVIDAKNSSDMVKTFILNCGIKNPSWSELRHFIKFLSLQLKSCELSIYCNESLVGDVLKGMKSFAVKCMIRMSRDFSTPSLHGEVSVDGTNADILQNYQIEKRRQWEQSNHPYLFFNEDGVTYTFVGFVVSPDGDLVDPATKNIIEKGIMTPQLYNGLKSNNAPFDEAFYRTWTNRKDSMISKLARIMGLECTVDPDPSYVLTVDNLIKILAIQMRFRSNIPVVIMGETGCGKTRLIRYMCDLASISAGRRNMLTLKVHGGTTEQHIEEIVIEAQKLAKGNRICKLDTVVFFDEANTTEAIGLIKEIMCDRRLKGKQIDQTVKFIAACNPYKKHSEEMIQKLESAGLGFYVQVTEVQQKLAKIPLRHLVYRVVDIPRSMRHLIYDFGQLNVDTEDDYIIQIVQNHISKHSNLKKEEKLVEAIAKVLRASQKYMRARKDECSYVSLRDVERAMIIFLFFYDKSQLFDSDLSTLPQKETAGGKVDQISPITRSVVLCVSICYHAKLQSRNEYEEIISKEFSHPLCLPGGKNQFRNEIQRCQEVLLDHMIVRNNIARNAALRENVFMMTICIELRIPLFLVGKPGSSKSLAKSIIADSMHGRASSRDFMKQFKQVQMFSYQCSQHSTPDSVIEVFNTAKRFQNSQDHTQFVSVVVLDEVGLAEDSPNLPLKALHPLLEDGTEGADKIISREERVAFIGISNWALDPAKMNRGVMVTRGNPDTDELENSAIGICSNTSNDPVLQRLRPLLRPLSEAYQAVCTNLQKDFFGLRDFYSLIKMLYWMCEKTGECLTWQQMEHAVRRNFGGEEDFEPITEFEKKTRPLLSNATDLSSITIMNPDCTTLGLIRTSLMSKETTWHGENRYLLFLTENYAALHILHHYLTDALKSVSLSNKATNLEPFVLFGSSFPKDKEYTQVCRNINQIKICMETGRTVILLNLENLYESLYDVLNQYYIIHGENRYVDLGLQTHRVKCRVHENFKLIMIAEKKTVYSKFPTPLINRLEKHFVLASSILNETQKNVLKDLEQWVQKFSTVGDHNRHKSFCEAEAFIGYQRDTAAAVVFQATTSHAYEVGNMKGDTKDDTVLRKSKHLLLQTTSPDAVIRLEAVSPEDFSDLKHFYLSHQYYDCLSAFLKYYVGTAKDIGSMMQVTTHGHLLSTSEVELITADLHTNDGQFVTTSNFFLQDFDTELAFSNKIGPSFEKKVGERRESLLIVQCESGHLDGDLIACARYRIIDERAKALEKYKNIENCGISHVLLIIHIPRQAITTSFVGFQSDPWISAHIDELRESGDDTINPFIANGNTISSLFLSTSFQLIAESEMAQSSARSPTYPSLNLLKCLHRCIQPAVCKIASAKRSTRGYDQVEILVDLIPKDHPVSEMDVSTFHGILMKHIHDLLQQRDQAIPSSDKWALHEACNRNALQHGGTFKNALARKLDDVITSVFSGVLTFIDQFSNLNLIRKDIGCTPVTNFWLAVFDASNVMSFKYGAPINMANNFKDFECTLPFFWIIKETFDVQWDTAEGVAQSEGELSSSSLCDQLCSLVTGTPIGQVLANFNQDGHHLYTCYLHDYLRSVHYSIHKGLDTSTLEYKVITNALDALVSNLCAERSTLIRKIAALHTVYFTYKQHIMWFGHLVTCFPAVLTALESSKYVSQGGMVLHLYAVQNALVYLEPPLKQKTDEKLCSWLYLVQKCQIIIDTMLSLKYYGQEIGQLFNSISRQWHRIRVIQLFVEHLVTKFKDMMPFVNRLNLALGGKEPDIFSNTLITRVKTAMNTMVSQLEKERCGNVQNIRLSCLTFFMQLITHVSFEYGTPNEDLIMQLISMVFAEKDGTQEIFTRQISPYKEETHDSIPIVRSSLLQLLLDSSVSSLTLQNYISDYFTKAQRVLSIEKAHDLYLLFMQCFEHTCRKKYESNPLNITFVEEGFKDLLRHSPHECKLISLEYLNAVAQVRFGLHLAAVHMIREVNCNEPVAILIQEGYMKDSTTISCLLAVVQGTCTDTTVNQIDQVYASGPLMYLLRLIVRRYGMKSLTNICKKYQWVQPPNLELSTEKENIIDEFVIYGDKYSQIQEHVSKIVYAGLEHAAVPKNAPNEVALFVLAVCNISITCKVRNQHFPPNAIKLLDQTFKTFKEAFLELYELGQAMMDNSPLLLHICESHETQNILTIVIHTAVIFFAKHKMQILEPFLRMLKEPSSLMSMYLPTMPDDPLYCDFELDDSYTDYYICSNKHKFFPNECGKTDLIQCPRCNSQKYQQGSLQRDKKEKAEAGYTLGKSQDRIAMQTATRNMTSAACCILRALMHAAYIWCCYNHENVGPGLVKDEQTSAQFFFNHLRKDIDNLSTVIGKSMDDSIRLLHIVLHDVLMSDPSEGAQFPFRLTSVQMRNHWEDLFVKTYIQPVLKSIDQRLNGAIQSHLLDMEKQGAVQNRFIYAIYEQAENSVDSFLWMYYPQITLQHLHQTLQSHMQSYPILNKFLCQEQYIRATRYIPDVAKLQQFLYKHAHHRMDLQQASRVSFAQFINKSGFSEPMCNAIKEWLNSLQSVWNTCRNMLPEYAKDKDREYFGSPLTEDTPLEYFIPTTTGAGVCTHLLMRFLVDTHNEFLMECDHQLTQKERSTTIWRRSDYSIKVENVQPCHLMNYESKIQSVLTAHCHYSIGGQGQGVNIHYDFPALEKHLVDRFVHGKPYIKYEIPHVVYQKDIYTTEHFVAIRKKVKPQERLPLQVQREILGELHTVDKLRSALDMVEMVMGFLASGGGIADQSLAVYTEKVLKLQADIFSSTDHCKLGHILSVWEIISVELAKQMTLHEEKPFGQLPEEILQAFSQVLDDNQKLELDKMLRRVQLDWILGVIYQLVELYLKDDKEKDSLLVEVLKVFIDVSDAEVSSQLSEFPQSIKFAQVIATWKHIVFYQENNI